jgi:hypothetical protein
MIGVEQQRAYRDLVDRVRAEVHDAVPRGARVLVITRGDDALLRLDGRQGGHFPQSPTGLYAGHYPADGAAVVAHLDELRRAGARYLVIPATAVWWLDHYPELRTALEERGSLVAGSPETALIYALDRPDIAPTTLSSAALDVARTAPSVSSLLCALLPEQAGVVLIGPAAAAIDVEDRPCWRLPAAPVQHVMEQASAACGGGARFVVLLHPARPAEQLDAGLRRGLAERLRSICAQRLAEIFEVPVA